MSGWRDQVGSVWLGFEFGGGVPLDQALDLLKDKNFIDNTFDDGTFSSETIVDLRDAILILIDLLNNP
jgi:hypothetical protein